MRRALPFAAAFLVLLVAGGLWLRDSAFFAVERVSVVGASGPDAPKVESALRKVARDMTTLHVDRDKLLQAVEGYPTVDDVDIDRDLPNTVTITVRERRPVAVVSVAGRRVPLTADGRLLKGATAAEDLPALALKDDPGNSITDERGRRLLALVAAAPQQLRRRTERAYLGRHGLTLRMNKGPSLYFGTGQEIAAKWAAAARVLADPTAEGARYIDVRVPERAAAGGLAAPEPVEQEEVVPGQTPAPAVGTEPSA
jgi:cell division protein FtsQ